MDSRNNLTTFTVFPLLPIELRLDILELALPGRRVLRVTTSDHFSQVRNEYVKLEGQRNTVIRESKFEYRPLFETNDTGIAMLRVSREAREVALKAFPYLLPSLGGLDEIRFNENDVIVIKEIDKCCVCLSNARRFQLERPPAISKIKYLGFYSNRPRIRRRDRNGYLELQHLEPENLDTMLYFFTNLEKIIVVSDGLNAIKNDGDCEGFVIGEVACDLADGKLQNMLAIEADKARNSYVMRARGRRRGGNVRFVKTPQVLFMAKRVEPKDESARFKIKEKIPRAMAWLRRKIFQARGVFY